MSQSNNSLKGFISLWKNLKAESKLKASGHIRVTRETLEAWAKLPEDDYGYISLDVALFASEKTSPNAPALEGNVKPHELRDGYSKPQARKEVPENEIPF